MTYNYHQIVTYSNATSDTCGEGTA